MILTTVAIFGIKIYVVRPTEWVIDLFILYVMYVYCMYGMYVCMYVCVVQVVWMNVCNFLRISIYQPYYTK